MNEDQVTSILDEWGKWQQNGGGSLDISTINAIGRLMEQGDGAGQSTGPVTPDMTPRIQAAEDAINMMPPRTQKVLRAKYIYGWSIDRTVSEYSGFTKTEVRQRIPAAINFFMGRLSNIKY
jgi:hypothetical protein